MILSDASQTHYKQCLSPLGFISSDFLTRPWPYVSTELCVFRLEMTLFSLDSDSF